MASATATEICGKCLQVGPEQPCGKCGVWFHLSCTTNRNTRDSFMCDRCRASPQIRTGEVSESDEDDPNATMRIVHSTPMPENGGVKRKILISDASGGQSEADKIRQLERDNQNMRAQIERLIAAVERNNANPVHSENNRSTATELPTTMGQSNATAIIRSSIRMAPMSRAQQECRRHDTDLPQFNGNPVRWCLFISSFTESTDSCGFSHLENLKRLTKALTGTARDTVEHLLPYPHRVPQIMETLTKNFGTSAALRSAMQRQVNNQRDLREDLANVGELYGVVEAIATAIDMADVTVEQCSLVEQLEGKLPMDISREWYRYSHDRPYEINTFREFIAGLCDDVARARRLKSLSAPLAPTKKPATKARVLLATEELPTRPPKSPERDHDECVLQCTAKHSLDKCPKFSQMAVNKRWTVVKKHRKCIRCFGPHWPSKCLQDGKCPVNECQYRHHRLLHTEKADVNSHTPAAGPTANLPSAKPKEFVGLARASSTIYRVVPVIATGKSGQSIATHALIDGGSAMSFIKTDLARRLGLAGPQRHIEVGWMENSSHRFATERVQLRLTSRDRSFSCQMQVNTKDNLSLPQQPATDAVVKEELLEDIPLEQCAGATPELLIGLDNVRLMFTSENRLGRSGRVMASRTPFGWMLAGQQEDTDSSRCLFMNARDHALHEVVKEYIEAEHFGLLADDSIQYDSDDNLRATKMMNQLTRWDGDKYETGLLWRSDDIVLPDNEREAKKRHESFLNKLRRDRPLWQRLTQLMENYHTKGYIRQVAPGQVRGSQNRSWYLPIFSVVNPNKPAKVRLVWDAAAQCDGVSLNSALLAGPDLNAPLIDVLIRFRKGEIAWSGDIEEMFHQVRIRESDRAAQRFIWQGIKEERSKIYEMCVMTFGASCSPTLAQFVKNLNAKQYEGEQPAAATAIQSNHYVDDWLESSDDLKSAVELARAVREIHKRGGFKIHKWASNSRDFLIAMDAPQVEEDSQVSQTPNSMVLGLNWLTKTDCFSFRWRPNKFGELTHMASDTMPTKRELLRMAMSLYDPLGLISYLTVLPRILLRAVWMEQLQWDENIPESHRKEWQMWIHWLIKLEAVQIPRWYGSKTNEPVDIHVFADASDKAIAAAAYMVRRRETSSGQPAFSALILSKCKVAPMKYKSIPRLELDAAVLAIRVLKIVQRAQAWQIDRVVFWSDAQDVLIWIRCTKRQYTPYVANRVANILNVTTVDQWRWVPSADNPADWATKYAERGEATKKSLWWNGPDFILNDESTWPNNHINEPEIIPEVKRILLARSFTPHPLIPPPEHFSSWKSLVRNTACTFKLIDILKKRSKPGSITLEELERAEQELVRVAQRGLDLKPNNMQRLSPFQDESGIWRMRGRTARATHLPYAARYPIILPNDHQVTRLIIAHYHHYSQHSHDQRAQNEFRQKFVVNKWINELNKVTRNCAQCQLQRARPLGAEMGALPLGRLAVGAKPFTHTGIDLFGPIEVAIGRRREKRWGVIFTCMTTRAIYLEIVASLDCSSCMMAIDSLAARRGTPRNIYSDCGTNFIAAAKRYRGPDGDPLEWRFNPPGTPHTGGSWERLIGITKKALTSMKMERTPTEERLRWFLHRAELLINSRPLIHLTQDPRSDVIITPNDLLLGSSSGLKSKSPREDDLGQEHLEDREKEIQQFWRLWTNGYLPSISARPKWTQKTVNLVVGDVVYLCDGDNRKGWRKGLVEETFYDEEAQQVRQVVVRTSDGARYRRGVAKVAPIVRREASNSEPAPLGDQGTGAPRVSKITDA